VAQRYCFAVLPSTGSEGDWPCFLGFRELAPTGVVFLIRVLRELIWRYRQQAGSHRGFCVVVGVGDWPEVFGSGEWLSVYGEIDQRICALNCPRI
jgi:hypothetical protein